MFHQGETDAVICEISESTEALGLEGSPNPEDEKARRPESQKAGEPDCFGIAHGFYGCYGLGRIKKGKE